LLRFTAISYVSGYVRLWDLSSQRVNYRFESVFSFLVDFRDKLILNRMLDVDRVEIGSSQCAGLRAGRSHKFARGDRERRYPKAFEFHRIVQTARRA